MQDKNKSGEEATCAERSSQNGRTSKNGKCSRMKKQKSWKGARQNFSYFGMTSG